VTASGPGIPTTTLQEGITVTAPGSRPDAVPASSIQPNILTTALAPFADIAEHPSKILSAVEIGLVLLLLAVLPAHLLNATLAEQSGRIERRLKRLPKRPHWLTSVMWWFSTAPVAAGLTVSLAAALLFGFADPNFGFTLASLRLVLACGIALFLVGYVANWLTAAIAKTQWHITVIVNTRPYGLILTIVGVVVSRLLHFSPGFLIGLILGLTIQGKSATGYAWRTVVTRTCIVLAMAIAAWIGYSTIDLGNHEGNTFGTALLVETLVAIVAEGVVALLVELLPLRFLEGERVYAHSRALWGILYFLTLVVFVLAVVPWEGNWDALGASLGVWITVLTAFALVCVGVYVYFRRFAKPFEEEPGSEEVALGETVSTDHT
jgi:magnesium-transporting ATPase (P-type)